MTNSIKRKKPTQHYRRIKTKKGPKKILINKGVRKQKEILKGGYGDNRPDSDFNPKELKMGLKIEREHSPLLRIRREISKDHLSEIPDYYTRLAEMERIAKLEMRAQSRKRMSKHRKFKRRRSCLKNERFINLGDREFLRDCYYNDSQNKNVYGEVKKISGKKLGTAIAASGFVVPVILPAPLTSAVGYGVGKKVRHLKLIKTDEHDNKYKVPRLQFSFKGNK